MQTVDFQNERDLQINCQRNECKHHGAIVVDSSLGIRNYDSNGLTDKPDKYQM